GPLKRRPAPPHFARHGGARTRDPGCGARSCAIAPPSQLKTSSHTLLSCPAVSPPGDGKLRAATVVSAARRETSAPLPCDRASRKMESAPEPRPDKPSPPSRCSPHAPYRPAGRGSVRHPPEHPE